jgi:predicted nucleic acid-binding Zn ribbon protein
LADEVDLANERIELEMANILAQRSNAPKAASLAPKGSCHYCDADIGREELYCDEECHAAHTYERGQRAHHRAVSGGTHYARYGQ